MMRAKADPKATSNSILLAACVLLAGSVAGLLWPKPTVTDVKTKEQKEAGKLRKDTAAAQKSALEARSVVLARTWNSPRATIESQVFNLANSLAAKRGVTLLRLQPQASMYDGSVEQVPLSLTLEGPFPAIVALERDLEAPANRLAVNSFQVTASDSESNKVAATVGVVAHRVVADVQEEKGNAKRS